MRRVRGFTLIEILVALFVLAVGVMGAAAAQNTAAQTRNGSAMLAAASQLASALGDSMAANPAQLALPDSGNAYLQEPGAPSVCTSPCTSDQLAAVERDDAAAAAARMFPGGKVRVCRDLPATPLAWDCTEAAGAPLVVKIGWRMPAFTTAVALPVPEAP